MENLLIYKYPWLTHVITLLRVHDTVIGIGWGQANEPPASKVINRRSGNDRNLKTQFLFHTERSLARKSVEMMTKVPETQFRGHRLKHLVQWLDLLKKKNLKEFDRQGVEPTLEPALGE